MTRADRLIVFGAASFPLLAAIWIVGAFAFAVSRTWFSIGGLATAAVPLCCAVLALKSHSYEERGRSLLFLLIAAVAVGMWLTYCSTLDVLYVAYHLRASDEQTRIEAAQALKSHPKTDLVQARVVPLLQDESPRVRAAAVQAFSYVKFVPFEEIVALFVRDRDGRVRETCLNMLEFWEPQWASQRGGAAVMTSLDEMRAAAADNPCAQAILEDMKESICHWEKEGTVK